MSSSFPDSFDEFAGDSPAATETHSFDDSYVVPQAFSNFDSTAVDYPPPVYVSAGELPSDPSCFSSETNENAPILPPPAFMEPEEGYALREWRRQNAARLEEKERKEKDLLMQIIVAADEYKVAVNRKWVVTCETNRETNREKEMGFVASQEKFHAEADKDYWKSIADLIPKEVPTIEKKKGKKEQDKRPSIIVVQGPKPGKPTDLSRMRQLLLKLKHNTPPHLKPSPPTPEATTSAAVATTVAVAAEAVAVN